MPPFLYPRSDSDLLNLSDSYDDYDPPDTSTTSSSLKEKTCKDRWGNRNKCPDKKFLWFILPLVLLLIAIGVCACVRKKSRSSDPAIPQPIWVPPPAPDQTTSSQQQQMEADQQGHHSPPRYSKYDPNGSANAQGGSELQPPPAAHLGRT